MSDIATLGIRVDSREANSAARELDRLKQSAGGAENAARRLEREAMTASAATRNLAVSAGQANVALRAMAGAFAGGLIGSAAMGLLTQLPQMFKDTIKEAADLPDIATNLGLTTKALQELQFAAKRSDVETRTFLDGLEKFNQKSSQAARGVGELGKVFKVNGVAIKDASGNLLPATELLKRYADLIANAKSPQDRLNLAVMAFGKSAGPEMVKMLGEGSAGLTELMGQAESAGAVLDESLIAKAKELDTEFKRASETMSTAFRGFAVEVAPYVIAGLEQISDMLKDITYTVEQLKKGNFGEALGLTIGKSASEAAALRSLKVGTADPGMSQGEYDSFFNSVHAKKPLDAGTIYGNGRPTKLPPAPAGPKSAAERGAETWQRSVADMEKRIALLKAEADTYGLSAAAQERARVTTELLAKAQAANKQAGMANTEATAAQKAEIDRLAASAAAATQALEDLQNRQEAIEYLKGLTQGFMSDFSANLEQGANVWQAFGDAALNALQSIADKLIEIAVSDLFARAFGGQQSSLFGSLAKLVGFAEGGYTGPGAKDQPAGVVHAGEYVFSKEATNRIGVGLLDRVHQNAKGYSAGGFVIPGRGYAEGGIVGPAGGGQQEPTVIVQMSNDFRGADANTIARIQAQALPAIVQAARDGAVQAVRNGLRRNPNFLRA